MLMKLREEFLFDFALNIPRILVCGSTAIIDNVRKVEIISTVQIVVQSGKGYVAVSGKNLFVKTIDDERMFVEGEITEVQFYSA